MVSQVKLPKIADSVVSSLNAFLMSLTHLPLEAQVDVLDQATKQISECVEESLQSI